jgi:hypothetical protein
MAGGIPATCSPIVQQWLVLPDKEESIVNELEKSKRFLGEKARKSKKKAGGRQSNCKVKLLWYHVPLKTAF